MTEEVEQVCCDAAAPTAVVNVERRLQSADAIASDFVDTAAEVDIADEFAAETAVAMTDANCFCWCAKYRDATCAALEAAVEAAVKFADEDDDEEEAVVVFVDDRLLAAKFKAVSELLAPPASLDAAIMAAAWAELLDILLKKFTASSA